MKENNQVNNAERTAAGLWCDTTLSSAQTLESRLKITLSEDLGEALCNGTVLCQLVNQIKPRSVSIIHIPSPAVVSLASCQILSSLTHPTALMITL